MSFSHLEEEEKVAMVDSSHGPMPQSSLFDSAIQLKSSNPKDEISFDFDRGANDEVTTNQ